MNWVNSKAWASSSAGFNNKNSSFFKPFKKGTILHSQKILKWLRWWFLKSIFTIQSSNKRVLSPCAAPACAHSFYLYNHQVAAMRANPTKVPIVINGEELYTDDVKTQVVVSYQILTFGAKSFLNFYTFKLYGFTYPWSTSQSNFPISI